jgi:Sulfotransferase family
MQRNANKPIFVVGSPRSGTSILTWCLGQHPNIFPVPESNWMGNFAVSVAMAYQVGASRGDRSNLSAMDIREDELFTAFGQSINDLILSHRKDLERKRQSKRTLAGIKGRWFQGRNAASDPKARWVDGTPEYSLFICGLRKLFPDARFVHIFRDVDAVVRSMLNFHRIAGSQLVANEEKAYKYWLRTVRACLKAEQAYGPDVVYRIRYVDLINNPEPTMRSLLDRLEEPYSPQCLEPLAERINSSNVPADFKADDPATDPAVVEKAMRLCANVSEAPQADRPSREAADEMEAAFRERVDYTASVDRAYKKTRQIIKALNYSGLPLYVVTQAVLAFLDPCVVALSQLS